MDKTSRPVLSSNLPFLTFVRPSSLPAPILFLSAAVFVLGVLFAGPVRGDTDPTAVDSDKSRRHLLLISKKFMVLQQEIDALINRPPSRDLTLKIDDLQGQMNKLELDFESMITQLPLEDTGQKKKKKTDWLEQIEELTKPLLNAIRDITAKPRMIDDLKNKIAEQEINLQRIEQAHKNISATLKTEETFPAPETQERRKYLAKLQFLKNKYDPELVRLNLERTKNRLERELSSDESIIDSAAKTIEVFLKTRGRNLLVTVGAFVGFWWILSRIRKWVLDKKLIKRISPSLNKLLSAAYNVFVLLFCMAISLACLYLFNDWLLISLIVMILILTAWTSRQWIPKFLQEIKLIVNLGTVREGERMIWQGVPWRVEDIGLQATLVNDFLEGGEIRLPVRELIEKHSRQVVQNEPWFPTKPHDWVILSDNTYGKIESQTMEQVVVRLKGGALKYYPTTDFLSKNPLNISKGFRYCIEFGLDYTVQSRVCDEIPKLFEEDLKKSLKSRFAGNSPDFTRIEVTFDNAGRNSLNLMIIVHVDGRCAESYEEFEREIRSALVKSCNENGLLIPLNQLTINLPEEGLVNRAGNRTPPSEDRV